MTMIIIKVTWYIGHLKIMFVAMIIQSEFIAQLKAILICVIIITMEIIINFILYVWPGFS